MAVYLTVSTQYTNTTDRHTPGQTPHDGVGRFTSLTAFSLTTLIGHAKAV